MSRTRSLSSFRFHRWVGFVVVRVGILLVGDSGLPDHDIHSQFLPGSTLQVDVFLELEAHLAVDDDIDVMRTLKIARDAISVRLCRVLGQDHKRDIISTGANLPCLSHIRSAS